MNYTAQGLEVPATVRARSADDGETEARTLGPDGSAGISRIDIIFYDVDHAGPSYQGRVFVNRNDADADTPQELDHGYVGAFTVFGHGGCYGDPGHCDIDGRTRDVYDARPPHPLTPWTKVVIVDPAAYTLFAAEAVAVSVVPVALDGTVRDDLRFGRVRLAVYAS